MTALKVGNVVLCEYVAKGMGMKHSLINAYHGDVVCESLPGNLQFGLFIEIAAPSPEAMTLEIFAGDDLVLRVEATLDVTNDEPSVAVLPQFIVEFKQDCDLVVKITPKGGKAKIVLQKKVYRGDPARFV